MTEAFQLYDTTLRDGAQREGISYSVVDKLQITRLLDEFGVRYIEGGWPGALPKDTEFFQEAKKLTLKNALLVAFGATCKPHLKASEDPQLQALLDSEASVITIVAKSDVMHVQEALKVNLEENLRMVRESVEFLVHNGKRVFVDCEHFFDGYRRNHEYGIALLNIAYQAGAEVGVLCDTNGGSLPSFISQVTKDVVSKTKIRIGIHAQDDTACAVANTIAAVEAGATHAQCTANGYGERTGNADLFSVIANLETKLGIQVLPEGHLKEAVRVSHAIAEIANLSPNSHQPYVGTSAFAHKAGLHASALRVKSEMYNHINPQVVGNDQRILVTEMAGRASIELKSLEIGYELSPEHLSRLVEIVKQREAGGWSYEAADASFELLLLSVIGKHPNFFSIPTWNVDMRRSEEQYVETSAELQLAYSDSRVTVVGVGNGPVNAIDVALRSGLKEMFGGISDIQLVDYKVRILEGVEGTDAVTRVMMLTRNSDIEWTTIGVHENIVEASLIAMVDAIHFGLLVNERK
jgi:2-isopropylmalate synthase